MSTVPKKRRIELGLQNGPFNDNPAIGPYFKVNCAELRKYEEEMNASPAPAAGVEGEDGVRGLYRKYDVRRLDDHTGKHAACEYYVLDLMHDKFAADALEAYCRACTQEFPSLAVDLYGKASKVRAQHNHFGPTNEAEINQLRNRNAELEIAALERTGAKGEWNPVAYTTDGCEKHHGQSWTTNITSVMFSNKLCPLCNPPADPPLAQPEVVPFGWYYNHPTAIAANYYSHGERRPDERCGWTPLYAPPTQPAEKQR